MSNQEEVAIKVEGVYKDFDLPHEAQNSLKTRILHPMSKGKNIEKQHALKDISFEVKKGEFFGIVGRNGSGKSTLLKILAEIYTPTKGKVNVNGSLTPFIELGVGFNPELTGRENVYLNGAMLGFSKKEMESMYNEIVDFAELEKFMDQKLKNYSSGMQVRLAFSVAIRAKSDILLLDEVLAVGDADFQRKCFEHLKKLKKDKRTVVFVSHDMSAVREYCDQSILIEKSELIEIGSPAQVSNSYTKLFIQDAPNGKNLETDSTRWGSFSLKTKSVATSISEQDIDIEQVIDILDDSKTSAIYGLHIAGADGKDVTAFNNTMIEEPSLKIDPNTKQIRINWSIQNILSDGTYYITLTLVEPNGEVIDWYEDATKIVIRKSTRSTTAIIPPASTKVSYTQK